MTQVLYIQYTNPAAYPPLEHSSRIIAENGHNVLFLGINELGKEDLVFPFHEGIHVKLLPACKPGWLQKFHYLWFCIWVLWESVFYRPNWVYASDLFSCPVALLLKALLGKKIIYHEHDTHINASTYFIKTCVTARYWLAQYAEQIIFPNKARAIKFIQENNVDKNKVQCIWNCPSLREITHLNEQSEDNNLWVIYHGSIVPGRPPVAIVQALALLPETVKLRIIGYETFGSQGYVQQLRNIARELGIEHRLTFLGALPRTEVFYWICMSSIGLSTIPMHHFDNINLINLTGASNKPFDNLACGIPLLVSDLPDWHQMFVEPGYALACNPDDPESIASALRWYIEHPDEMRNMGVLGQKRIQDEWNYESQFELFRNKILCPATLEE